MERKGGLLDSTLNLRPGVLDSILSLGTTVTIIESQWRSHIELSSLWCMLVANREWYALGNAE